MPIPLLNLISKGLSDMATKESLALFQPPDIEPNLNPEPILKPPQPRPQSITDGVIVRRDLERLLDSLFQDFTSVSPTAGEPTIETFPVSEEAGKPTIETIPISEEAGRPTIETIPMSYYW